MGYYTHYTLKVSPETDKIAIAALRLENEWADAMLQSDGSSDDSGKWYEHETDMREFSKKHPETLFILSGEGEESGDIWTKYFKDGKCQSERACIVVGEFDEAKLT